MPVTKSILVVGLDPALIDFSQPGYPPGMTAAKVFAGVKSSEEELTRLGYSVQTCFTDFGKTARTSSQAVLQSIAERHRRGGPALGVNPRERLP